MRTVERLGPARPGDAARIAHMSRTLVEHGLSWRWGPRAVSALIGDADTDVVVARSDRALAGFAIMQFRFAQRRAHLVLLAVDPAHRRRGLGGALFRWEEVMARRAAIASVALEVRAGNAGARAFYRSLGFRETEVLRGYYQQREDAVRMVARLGPPRAQQ